jgi:hypothetical protein
MVCSLYHYQLSYEPFTVFGSTDICHLYISIYDSSTAYTRGGYSAAHARCCCGSQDTSNNVRVLRTILCLIKAVHTNSGICQSKPSGTLI